MGWFGGSDDCPYCGEVCLGGVRKIHIQIHSSSRKKRSKSVTGCTRCYADVLSKYDAHLVSKQGDPYVMSILAYYNE